jgi:hypothetical protein
MTTTGVSYIFVSRMDMQWDEKFHSFALSFLGSLKNDNKRKR